jgi:hypothetical protein
MFVNFIKEKRAQLRHRFPNSGTHSISKETAGESELLVWVIATILSDCLFYWGYLYTTYLATLPTTEALSNSSWIEIFSSMACFHWLGITKIFETIRKIDLTPAREVYLRATTQPETTDSIRFKNAFHGSH